MNSLNRLIKIADYFLKLAEEDHKLTEVQISETINLGIDLAKASNINLQKIQPRYPEIPDQDPESDARKICPKVKERVGLGIQRLTNELSDYFHQNPINPKQNKKEKQPSEKEQNLMLSVASIFSLPEEVLDILFSSASTMFSATAEPVSNSSLQNTVRSLVSIINDNPELQNDSDFVDAYCYAFPFVLSGFIAAIIFQNQ